VASGDWRRNATGFIAESPEFASQRLGHARITRGNVGSSRTTRKRIGETALAWLGWEDSNSLTNRSDDDRLKRSGGHATD